MNTDLPKPETKNLFVWLAISALIWAAVAVMTRCSLIKRPADGKVNTSAIYR